ncbi:Lsr2 family protein [Streptacidiphilus pinicola]|uniref:Lsr2 family protein n=1 Tax=Streptacidiphilus pinicola TaxID=2219663 RepID=A0A2X0IM21_9ACTN|nr:Lsr2 family protein [Streptacidiphilus pinicola]RAG86172.1 Lsr2 family protein [Streptacidiphilus pinicola]
MAQKVTVQLLDDLDGSEAAETVSFALDGRSYEIDLNEANAAKLRDAVASFVKAARRQGATSARKTASVRATSGDGPSGAEVRKWAASHGIEVAARGRVPAEIVEQYQKATGK